MPEPNTGDRNSHGSRFDEFRTAKSRRGSPDVCPGPGCAKIITIFQWILIFEQSVNHRRGPRPWPQIGAAATWLLGGLQPTVVNLNLVEESPHAVGAPERVVFDPTL